MAKLRTETAGGMRMGSVTVIAMVVVICLAVLSVLALVSARASSAEVERQASFVSGTYINESAGQRLLSDIDAALAQAAADGLDADAAMDRVAAACPDAAKVDGRIVRVAYATDVGRRLTIKLRINDDLTYTVVRWTASTDWTEQETEEGLLSGM